MDKKREYELRLANGRKQEALHKKLLCKFRLVLHTGHVTAIVDEFDLHKSERTVSEDAACVVFVLYNIGLLDEGQRLLYCNPLGGWNEIKHDGFGNYTGLVEFDAGSLDEALNIVGGNYGTN